MSHCPFCKTNDDEGECSHFFAAIDHTFLECTGGFACDHIDELVDQIRGTFEVAIKESQAKNLVVNWGSYRLQELWDYAVAEFDKESEIDLDGDNLYRILAELFSEITVEIPQDMSEGDEIPGYSSSQSWFYSEKPTDDWKRIKAQLDQMLKDRTTGPRKQT